MADLPTTGVVTPQTPPAPAAAPAQGASSAGTSPAAVLAAAKQVSSGTPAPAAQAGGMVPLAALQEERERRQSLQADLEALKAQVGRIQQQSPQQQYQQQPQQPQVDFQAELNRLWETDPRKAVQQEILLAAQWQDNIAAQVDQESEALAGRYKDFNNFRGEAMRYVRSLPLEQRARPGIVEMAYMLARGQGVDQIVEQQRLQLQQQFQQNPAAFQMPTGSGATPPPSNSGPVGLTEEQMKVARAMGLSPEGYTAGIRK